MAKQSQVIRYMKERRQPGNPRSPARLYYERTNEKFLVCYEEIAQFINADIRTRDYFVDTNWITSHDVDRCVWDALSKKRMTFTQGVWSELEAWRETPFYNKHMVEVLDGVRDNRSGSILFDEESKWGIPCGVFRNYYVNVLAHRKRKAVDLVSEFILKNKRQPTKVENDHLFQKGFDERDINIFRKGHAEITSEGNVFTDEELVATAAMVSLSAGVNTTILTRDHDVLEQFFKLTQLLTGAYQATLFAKRFAGDRSSFQIGPMPKTEETDAYFYVDESYLVKKPVDPDDFVAWLLPSDFEQVRMRCILFTGQGPEMAITPLSFIAETPMIELVEAKGFSSGWNTNLLDGKNCHVTGFTKGIPDPRSWTLVSKDKTLADPDDRFHFSLLELAHAVYHFDLLRTIEEG